MSDFDLAWLVALILFAVAGVIRITARSIDGALVAFGLACAALGVLLA